MLNFEGLNLLVDEMNFIDIDESCLFQTSRIIINGKGNSVKISKAALYQSLFINIKGNNKIIEIGETSKSIRNLKIVSIRGNKQKIKIGSELSCGGCEIQMNDGDETLQIDDDCLFSWGIKMRTSDGHSVVDIETNRAINLPKNIYVGKHVWIGEDVKILKGGVIPSNSIVASNSVVTKAFADQNVIIAGIPAKISKTGVNWHRDMPFKYNERNKVDHASTK